MKLVVMVMVMMMVMTVIMVVVMVVMMVVVVVAKETSRTEALHSPGVPQAAFNASL